MTQEPENILRLPENMREREAAKYLGISRSALAKSRMSNSRHDGPIYAKVAGCIIYRRSDLDAWLVSHLVETE